MLSQVKRRLLYPSLMVSSFLETAARPSLLAHFCSENDNSQKPGASAGLSKPVKRQAKKKDATWEELFLLDNSKSSAKAKEVSFKKQSKRVEQNLSEMKPSQLNKKMAQAAKGVAAHIGHDNNEVIDDLMSKLHDIFPEIDYKKKNVTKKSDRKKNQWSSGETVLKDVTAEGLVEQANANVQNAEFDVKHDVDAAIDAFNKAPVDKFDKQFAFARKTPFSTLDQLYKSEKPLGIFSAKFDAASTPSVKLWPAFEEAEIQRLTRFEPLNWFDQCIQWTEKGQLWHFPIDNEQGLDKEAAVDFSEHLFLDHHAESWCPKEGPVRHFMELVFVGLSKNPYLTLEEKRENIEWYHQYFLKHKALLVEIDAFGSPQNPIEVDGKLS